LPSPLIEWRQTVIGSGIESSARLVALVLSMHMNRNGGSCFPSLTTLQRETGLSRTCVCKALKELEAAKLIERLRSPGRVTHYLATSPLSGLPLVRSADSTSPPDVPEDVQEDVHNPSPRVRAGGKEQGRRARGARPTGHAHADPSYLDRSGR
jgi:hypothetical protein